MKKNIAIASAILLLSACSNKETAYDATGIFEATEVTVSAKSSGELKEFDVKEGMNIEKSQLVGSIDTYQLQLKKKQLETSKTQLQANKRQLGATKAATDSKRLDLEKQVAAIRQQIANARNEQRRFTELVNDGAVARKQLDDISYQIQVLERQLEATQDQIRSNNASLAEQASGLDAQIEGLDAQQVGIEVQQAQIDDQIANSDVVAPIGGTVLEKYVERGEFVSVGKPLFKMADVSEMSIRAYVTTAQLEHLKLGQEVTVYADFGNGERKAYAGKVSWISDRSEFTPKTILTDDERADLVYAVKVSVKNDGFIKIGMYGGVVF